MIRAPGLLFSLIPALSSLVGATEADWPMWRYDAERSAMSPAALPDQLVISWERDLGEPRPAFRNSRLGFDAGHEPIVASDLVFVGSSIDDSLRAFRVEDGALSWRYTTDGPIRFAPAFHGGYVYAGSDDGHLYCLDATTGRLAWRFRAAPSKRQVLGNRRLISLWPVRGGVVARDGRVYFAAGVWPFEGVFVYCLDARSGEVLWINDDSGFVYGGQPHNGEAFGGLTPQGYLVIDDDELVVPCGTAYPARFDLATGRRKQFSLPTRSRFPGGWFAAVDREGGKAARRGRIQFDSEVNSERHEDNLRQGSGTAGVRSRITLAGESFSFDRTIPGVRAPIHTALVARSRLIVVDARGTLYCLASQPGSSGAKREGKPPGDPTPTLAGSKRDKTIMGSTERRDGWAAVVGLVDGSLVEALLAETRFSIVAFDEDADTVRKLRERWIRRGVYGKRVAVHRGSFGDTDRPPYFASLITTERRFRDPKRLRESVLSSFASLQPHGGVLCLPLDPALAGDLRSRGRIDGIEPSKQLPGSSQTFLEDALVVHRRELHGARDYLGGFAKTHDELAVGPYGVLWFDDTLGHFKRSPQPRIVSGLMVSRPKEWTHDRRQRTALGGYKLLPAIYSDIYTGRVLTSDESEQAAHVIEKSLVGGKTESGPQPNQYRPATQKNAWKPEPPQPGTRIHPMTGQREPRRFPKSYGCDGGVDYGNVYTMRSATAAVYDLVRESGTFHISGPRSGCTNSVIPAGGLLNVPFFYEGCTCSYPLPVGLALHRMDELHEQWTSWGSSTPGPIERVGLNFGAPGDRRDADGTLWLDVPSVGGPSPQLDLELEPPSPKLFYRHSMFIEGGRGWPWVAASGADGLRRVRLSGLRNGEFVVRLTFCDPGLDVAPTFDVRVQGKPLAKSCSPRQAAGGVLRSTVEECRRTVSDGTMVIELEPGPAPRDTGTTLLGGIELVHSGLPLGRVRQLAEASNRQLEKPTEETDR